MAGTLREFPNVTALTHAAAELIVSVLQSAQIGGGMASIALAGGATPRAVYELLATERFDRRCDWSRIHFFWGDERCVEPDSSESNYRMAYQALLRHRAISPAHIHRMHGELSPAEAAHAYEQEIRLVMNAPSPTVPRFSIVVLGIGENGHTASLFPGSPVLEVRTPLVASTLVGQPGTHRVTMTLPLLNNGGLVLFLVAGPAKAAILRTLFRDESVDLPARHILPTSGPLFWYVDADAAVLLHSSEAS